MAISSNVRFEDDSVVFASEKNMEERVEGFLRYHYSRRLFVQDFQQLENGYSVRVGIAYPRDVSDRRQQDDVLKMVNIGDVATFQVTPGEGNYHRINLPDRSAIYESFREQRQSILTQLDGAMATAIYERVYELSPVRTQLNAVVELIDYVRNDGPLSLARLGRIQSTSNTEEYVNALADLEFLRIDESNVVTSGSKIDLADDQGWNDEKVIGQVIQDGYTVLRQKFGLTMLNHFPVFANGYYLSAFRREKEDLYLTRDDIVQNLRTEYHQSADPLKVDRKLKRLDEVDVLEYKNNEVSSVGAVYEEVSRDLPAVG
jgi:hypothetical protein